MRLLFAACALLLAGCSISDPDPEALAFEPLLDSSTFVQRQGFGSLVYLSSEADEADFREMTGADAFPRPIDYAREAVVGIVFGAARPDGRIVIQSMTLDGDEVAFVLGASGSIGLPQDSVAVAFPSSFVTTRPLRFGLRGGAFRYTDL